VKTNKKKSMVDITNTLDIKYCLPK